MSPQSCVPAIDVSRRSVLRLLALCALVPVPDTQHSGPPSVLFLCPHGAAKSVLASAYFKAVAAERGLRVRVDFAGIEPDAEIAPKVRERLRQQGLEPSSSPRQVTAGDLEQADVVISLGCDLSRFPGVDRPRVQQWDVPGPGEHFAESDAEIRRRVIALVDELVRQRQ
jgi:arsenate reductase